MITQDQCVATLKGRKDSLIAELKAIDTALVAMGVGTNGVAKPSNNGTWNLHVSSSPGRVGLTTYSTFRGANGAAGQLRRHYNVDTDVRENKDGTYSVYFKGEKV